MESMLLDAAGHRRSPRPCLATTEAARRATRARSTWPIRRQSRKSSLSCAWSVTVPTLTGFAR